MAEGRRCALVTVALQEGGREVLADSWTLFRNENGYQMGEKAFFYRKGEEWIITVHKVAVSLKESSRYPPRPGPG